MKKTDRKSVNIKLTKTRNNLLNEDNSKLTLAPDIDESCWDEFAKNSVNWIAVGAGYSILLGSHAEELVKTAFKGGTGAVSVSSAAVDAAVQFNAQRKSNGLYSAAKNNKLWIVSKDAASRTVLGALKLIYNMYAGLALGSFAKAKNLTDMGFGKTSWADLGKGAAHGILGVKKGVISIVLMVMTWQGLSRAWNGKPGAPTEKDNKDGNIVLAALKNLADMIIAVETNVDWIIKTGAPFNLNPSDPLGAPQDSASGTGGGLVISNSKCFAMNSISSAIAARAVWHAIFAMVTGKAGRAFATAGAIKNAGQIEEVLKSTFKAAYRKFMDRYKVNAKRELNSAWADSLSGKVIHGLDRAKNAIDEILDDIILASANSKMPTLEKLGERLGEKLREIKNPEGAQLIADDVIGEVVGSFKKKVSEIANRSFNRNAKEAKKIEADYRATLESNRAQAAQRVEALFRSHKAAAAALEAATSPAAAQASNVMPAERAAVEAAEAVSTIRLQAALENLAKLGKGGTEAGDEVASLLAARLSDKVSKEIRIKLANLIPQTDASVDEILTFFRNIDDPRFDKIVKELTKLVNDARQADGQVANNVFDLFSGAPVGQSANIAEKVTGIDELIIDFVKRITDPGQKAAAIEILEKAAAQMKTKLAAASKASPARIASTAALFEGILAMVFAAVLAVTKDEPDKTVKEVSALIRAAGDPEMKRVKNYMDFMLNLSARAGDDKIDVEAQFDNFIISCINTLETRKTDEKIANGDDFTQAAMEALDFSKDGCNFLEFLKKQVWFTQWSGKEIFLQKNSYGSLDGEQNKIIFTLITGERQEIKSLAKAAWNSAAGKGGAKFNNAVGLFKSKVATEEVLFSFEDWKSRIKSLGTTTKNVKDVKESVISNKSELRSLVSDFLKENYGQGYAKYPYSSGQGESEEPREDYVQDWKALEIEIMRDKTRGAAIDLAKILVQDLELFNDVLDLAGQNQSIGSEILAKLRNNKDTEEDS